MVSSLSSNLRNYVVGLVVLVICAAAYNAASSQLLRVPEVAKVTPRPPTQTSSATEGLSDLFPQDAWQLGDCKRLLTSGGTLLFKEWEQIAPDRWVLEPLTIVIGRGISKEPAAAPIILNAAQGAEIQFAESLDMMGGTAPPIKMGRMIGDVFIQRANVQKSSEALSVQTRNVRIDNSKVWTTEKIKMQVAGADLRGIDLTIYLAASATSAAKAETPSTILDRMDLVYLEELRIPLDREQGLAGPPRRIGTGVSSVAPPPERGVISVKCKNGLGYDFAVDRLSLRDSIAMVRTIRGEVVDTFFCDTLDMALRDPADQSVLRRGPLDWINRVSATGRPAMIDLSSYGFQLDADEIDFDATGGLLRAKGKHGIRVRRNNIEANLAELAYQFNPDTPETLGSVDVRGPGNVSIDEPGIMLHQLSWAEGFKLQPTGEATVDAFKAQRIDSEFELRVDGNIRARLSDGGNAQAGSIVGILKPLYLVQPSDSGSAPQAANQAAQTTDSPERKITLVPKVFHALDGVSIDTNQVAATMDRLSLFFEIAADYGKRPEKTKATLGNQDESSNGPGGLASWINQPAPVSDLHAPVSRQRPTLSGNSVSAQLLVSSAGIQPKDVSIEGNVMVEHQVDVGQSLMPIQMTGQTMRLQRSNVTQASGKDYLQLGSGPESPARLTMGDGFFVGPVIKVWPSENVVQVDGAGQAQVPSELLKKTEEPTSSRDPQPIAAEKSPIGISNVDWISPPLCRWGGSMQFDGQAALLTGGVQIDAELVSGENPWSASMNGDEMQISLLHPVSITEQASMSTAQLAEINLVQTEERPVVVRAEQRSADQITEAIHLITARRLIFAPQDGGRLIGAGPGWYRGWVMMDQKRSIVTPQEPKPRGLGKPVLQGVHLTFHDSMQGDLKNETLAFTGGVRTGVRELQSWNEAVDVNQMERLAIGEMTMDCGQLKFGITPGMPEDLRRIPGMPTPWELTADGGVVVRTNTEARGLIEGTATRASYESKKSWLNVEGVPGQNAFIRQTWPNGKPANEFESPRMLLNLKTYEFQTIMKGAQINGVTLPK